MESTNKDLYDEINIKNLFEVLSNRKLFILITTVVFSFISLSYALILPDKYVSIAVLAPANEENYNSGGLSSLSSLAGVSGLGLSSNILAKKTEAIKRIESYEFFSKYFLPSIKLQDLMAVDKWYKNTNTIYYNSRKFVEEKNIWTEKDKPSIQDSYQEYRKILTIFDDKKTSFVTISIEHFSPNISKQWTEILLEQIDENMRSNDRVNAVKSIDFLKTRLESTKLEEIRAVISNLIASQEKILMLSETSSNYIFKVIDSPYAPEENLKPNRLIILIVGTFFGFLSAVIYTLLRYLFRKD